jgi:tetrachlorobenzoquinone reductase
MKRHEADILMAMAANKIQAKLNGIAREAEDICLLELAATDGAPLAPFSAGAHIDLHLANGLVRSYSLVNSPVEKHRYVIGVKKEAAGRGGSRFIHEQMHVGEVIEISAPRNNFALREDAGRSILIAGGIGITPLACMSRRLEELGKPWELHYTARDRCSAAFVPQLAAFGPKVNFYFPTEFCAAPRAARIDIGEIVQTAPRDAHIYCCGPGSMLAAFQEATAGHPVGQAHVEFFSNSDAISTDGAFDVVLAKSGQTLKIPSGKTILDVLLARGIDAPYSCLEGVCSSCETRVVSGVPDHRDLILTTQERAAGDRMMICCSRSKSQTLVLDL